MALNPPGWSPPVISYGVSAQSSSLTCTTTLQTLLIICDPYTGARLTCCTFYESQVNAYPSCFCSVNSTILTQLATACFFRLPQNLTSCFSPGTYIHAYIYTYRDIHICSYIYVYMGISFHPCVQVFQVVHMHPMHSIHTYYILP